MKDRKKLIEVIEKYVSEPYKRFIVREIRSSIRLKTTGLACDEIGMTKLGGCPDLSKKISWATSKFDGKYLSFLGQINLGEIEKYDESRLLPNRGMLYFFFNLESGDDGRVIYSEEIDELERAVVPDELKTQKKSFIKIILTGRNEKRVLNESEVEICLEYNFPSWDSLKVEKIYKELEIDLKPINAFGEDLFENINDNGENEMTSNHHLVGNYKGIQNECHELNFIDFTAIDLTLDEIERALEWELLFQFDSDENLGVILGDWGKVYFFIHKNDLKKKRFDNVKISADCY